MEEKRNKANLTLTAFSDRKDIILRDAPTGRNSQMNNVSRTGSQLGGPAARSGSKIAKMHQLNSMRHMNTDVPNSRVQAIRMNPEVKQILKTQKREFSQGGASSNPISPMGRFNQTTAAFTSAQDPVSPTPNS